MYTPEKFKVTNRKEIYAFIKQHPFGLLLTVDNEEIHDTHTPFILSEKDCHLYGHIAKANPQWKHWKQQTTAKVIFTGAHTYISPQYYTSEFNVPTWNYTAVSLSGALTIIEDESKVLEFLDQLVSASEPTEKPWQLDRSDERYMKLLSGIVVFKIDIDKIDASFKLNQNKSTEDQQGVIDSLKKSHCPFDHTIAKTMKENLDG